jgi:hypothetical protein
MFITILVFLNICVVYFYFFFSFNEKGDGKHVLIKKAICLKIIDAVNQCSCKPMYILLLI